MKQWQPTAGFMTHVTCRLTAKNRDQFRNPNFFTLQLCYLFGILDITADHGSVRPLDEARMHALTVNRVQLLDLIDSSHAFITELASPAVGCITWPQRDHIVNIIQPRDRNEKLLEFLTRKSVASFNAFINILSMEQEHLVPLLVTDGSKTFCLYM